MRNTFAGIYNYLKKDNFNFSISKEKLLKKIKNFENFKQDAIDKEFEYFKNKNDTSIDETIKNFKSRKILKEAHLVRVKIQNNKVKYKNYLSCKFHPRFIRFHFFLKKALLNLKFPDSDFLVSMHDSFDKDIWLDNLKAPVFCISKKIGNEKVILMPHVEWMKKNDALIESICKADLQKPWNKKIPKVIWRGTTTGVDSLEQNERLKIVKLTVQYPHIIEAFFSKRDRASKLDKKLDDSCFLKLDIPPSIQARFKYLLAIDGHAFAGSFFWQLFSNSLVLKNKSKYLEWYYIFLKNQSHFLEYENEGDLINKISWLNKNDFESKKIAKSAFKFASENLTNEDLVCYFYKLIENNIVNNF